MWIDVSREGHVNWSVSMVTWRLTWRSSRIYLSGYLWTSVNLPRFFTPTGIKCSNSVTQNVPYPQKFLHAGPSKGTATVTAMDVVVSKSKWLQHAVRSLKKSVLTWIFCLWNRHHSWINHVVLRASLQVNYVLFENRALFVRGAHSFQVPVAVDYFTGDFQSLRMNDNQ